MSNKGRVLALCDSSGVFNAPSVDFVNRAFNMDFSLRVVRPIRKLLADNTVTVVSLDGVTSTKLRRARLAFKSFEEFVAHGMMTEAGERAMSLIRHNQAFRSQEALYYDGIFLPELVELYPYVQLRRLIFNIELLKRIIEAESPDMIMVSDSESPGGRASLAVARQVGIPFSSFSTPLLRLKHIFEKRLKIHLVRLYEGKEFSGATKLRQRDYQKMGTNSRNKILMLSDELRHAPQVIPWAKELVRDGKNELLIIDMNPWSPEYGELNNCLRVFSQYADKNLEKKVRQEAKRMLTSWHRLQYESTLRQSLIYENVFLFDFFKDTISYIFKYSFDKLIRYIEVTKLVIQRENPDVIVVMDERSPFGRAVVAVCELRGVPSLVLQHGIHDDQPHYGLTYATKMSVYGDFTKKVLVKRGVSPEKIVLTGAPQWDELVLEKGITREEFCRQMGLDEGKGLILLATAIAFDREIGRKVVAGVINAVREFPNMQLLIRAHPSSSEPVSLYKDIAEEMGAGNIVVFKKPHDYDSIRACDIFITQYSTVAIDAIIAGKPVITINLSGDPDHIPYAGSGAAIGVYRTEDIAPAIKDILTNPSVRQRLARGRKRFLAEHLYKTDGQASRRVAALIEMMAEERKVA